MAIRFHDSVTRYGTTIAVARALAGLWWGEAVGFTLQTSALYARPGTLTLLWSWGGYVQRAVPSADEYIVGLRFTVGGYDPNGDTITNILRFGEGSTTHIGVGISSSGAIRFTRNHDQATALADSVSDALGEPLTLLPGVPRYLEVRVKVHDSAGEIELRVDGVPVILKTGLDTRNGGALGQIDRITLGRVSTTGGSGFSAHAQDIVILDRTGSVHNDFLGDVAVDYLPAASDGADADGAIGGSVPAATRWQSVDEVTPNDGVDFVELDVGEKFSVGLASLDPATDSVIAVAPIATLAKDGAGLNTGRLYLRSGGTVVNGPAAAPSTSYTPVSFLVSTDPSTGVAFTPAAVAALEVGYERLT